MSTELLRAVVANAVLLTCLSMLVPIPIFASGAPAGASASPSTLPPSTLPPATLPPPEQLPSVVELPDPFRFNDGSRVKTKADWRRRREELKDLILGYEYGRMPPPPGKVTAADDPAYEPPPPGGLTASRKAATGPAARPAPAASLPTGAREIKLRLATGPAGGEQTVSFPLILTLPPGRGPFPVVVKGDLCWGRVKPAIVAEVVRRGYMLAEFDRTAVAPDTDDRATGVYALYPDYDWRGPAAWAWGFHRVIDYLLTRDDVDAARVIVTGHSRGGKAVLLAGALDERIALTCPNGSGAGGAGCWRYQAPKSEDIKAITGHFPFWFSPNFPAFIGHLDRLPFDQHSLKALVAPRALLSTEGLGDLWANPEGTQVTYTAARVVFDFLGVGDKIGIHFRPGGHDQTDVDFTALLDFADKVLFGKKVEQSFDKLAFPDAPRFFSWTADRPGEAPATTQSAPAIDRPLLTPGSLPSR